MKRDLPAGTSLLDINVKLKLDNIATWFAQHQISTWFWSDEGPAHIWCSTLAKSCIMGFNDVIHFIILKMDVGFECDTICLKILWDTRSLGAEYTLTSCEIWNNILNYRWGKKHNGRTNEQGDLNI